MIAIFVDYGILPRSPNKLKKQVRARIWVALQFWWINPSWADALSRIRL